jgi:diacylglycerol kinase family enzyme
VPDSFTVVANDSAGSSDREAVARVGEFLAEHGAEVEVVWTEGKEELGSLAAALACDRLVVVGGDGSISAAVHELLAAGRAEVPVALVPLGTGNDLARGLGIPLDVDDAARLARDGRPVPRPVLRTGERTAVNALHVGVGAAAADRAKGLKSVLGPTAYPAGAVAAGTSEPGWDLEVTVDDAEPVSVRALLLACMVGSSIGGGTEVVPLDEHGDQEMGVVIVGATGGLARAGFGLDLLRGRHLERDDVVHGPARRVELRAEPPVPVNLDGELLDPVGELSVQVEPAAWSLVVPGTGDEGTGRGGDEEGGT